MTIFFGAMFLTVYYVGSRLGFNYRDAVAVAFNATGRDFEIAIAITAFNPAVALATLVGPLIEVPVMLTLDWIAMRTEKTLFGTETARAEVAVGRSLVAEMLLGSTAENIVRHSRKPVLVVPREAKSWLGSG